MFQVCDLQVPPTPWPRQNHTFPGLLANLLRKDRPRSRIDFPFVPENRWLPSGSFKELPFRGASYFLSSPLEIRGCLGKWRHCMTRQILFLFVPSANWSINGKRDQSGDLCGEGLPFSRGAFFSLLLFCGVKRAGRFEGLPPDLVFRFRCIPRGTSRTLWRAATTWKSDLGVGPDRPRARRPGGSARPTDGLSPTGV